MALQAALTDPASGARASKAYLSIPRVLCRFDDGDLVDVRVAIYGSAKTKASGLEPQRTIWLHTDLQTLGKFVRKTDGADIRPAAYRWLKKRKPAEGELDLRGSEKV